MDNISPKLAATFGVGFIGFILAAYSYNKYHKPEYTEELIHNTENEEKSTNENNTNENNTEENNISLEVKEELEKKSRWTSFWKNEFINIKNNKKKQVKSNYGN